MKKTGKHSHNELRVKWYCANCWQRGLVGITVVDSRKRPTLDELYRIVKITSHTDCKQPNIRLAS